MPHRSWRAWIAALLLLFCIPIFPKPVFAAVSVHFQIAAVQMDESVTIRTSDFPVRTNFVARMGKATRSTEGAVVAGQFNSGAGGVGEFTIPIPPEMRGQRLIGLTVDSVDGYSGYNWFFNRTATSLIADTKNPPALAFSNVKKNTSVTLNVTNMPPNTNLRVRIGPFDGFYRSYVSVADVPSDASGAATYTAALPAAVKDQAYISVRVDGGGKFAFATFQNVDGGAVAQPAQLIQLVPCTVLNLNVIPAQEPRADFDVTWTVRNTGGYNWQPGTIDFKFTGGTEMHKYEDIYDLNWNIKRDDIFQLTVDMLAPAEPGYYKSNWAILENNRVLCTMSVGVWVK